MNWNGRTAIVTGGASGIGEATAREFVREGVAVAVFDINAEAGENLAGELRQEGGKAIFARVDVSDAAQCQSAALGFASQQGRLDYLVNSAVSFIGKGLDATPPDWERSLSVNVQGNANMAQACHPLMKQTGSQKQSGGGAIVNISSISAHIAQPNRWTYNACKGAILALTRCQALDMATDNIRVNVVSPGWTWTPGSGQSRAGRPGQMGTDLGPLFHAAALRRTARNCPRHSVLMQR